MYWIVGSAEWLLLVIYGYSVSMNEIESPLGYRPEGTLDSFVSSRRIVSWMLEWASLVGSALSGGCADEVYWKKEREGHPTYWNSVRGSGSETKNRARKRIFEDEYWMVAGLRCKCTGRYVTELVFLRMAAVARSVILISSFTATRMLL